MSVRKHRWTILGGGVALALTVTAAVAEPDLNSANYLLPFCRGFGDLKSSVPFEQGRCAGIVSGIAYMGSAVEASSRVCLDIQATVTSGQDVKVVVAYIDARPARLHEPFARLALEALRAAWPCK
jgi:Rap1a immunity proteins